MLSSIRVHRDIIDPWIQQESIFQDADKKVLTELSSIRETVLTDSSASWISVLTVVFAVVGMILAIILCRFRKSIFWIIVGYLRALAASSVVGRTSLIVSIEVEREGITQSLVRLTEQVLSDGMNTTVEHIDSPAIMQASTSQLMHPTPESISIPLEASARGNTADLDEEQDLDNLSFYSFASDLL